MVVAAGSLLPLLAQADRAARGAPVVLQPIEGAAGAVFAVVFDHGIDDDAVAECGAARVLARCRQVRAERAVPAIESCGVHVGSDLTVVIVPVDGRDWRHGVAFVRALLDDALPLDDDEIRLATARAALIADDAEWLYPGPVLQSRARRALLGDRQARAVQGSAVALQRLTTARVRELLGQPVGVELEVFGALPPAAGELRLPVSVAGATTAADAGPPPAGEQPAAAPSRSEPELTPHPRVDAPFVAIAFPAPAIGDWAAFAVGVEVARLRALRRLPRVADQAMARAPAVAWSWLEADPLVVFCRRGRDGDQPAAAFAELEALLADLRERPPTPRELEKARRALLGELSPLPWSPELTAAVRQSPAALAGRVAVAVRARRRGITAAAIADVTGEMAHRVLGYTLLPAGGWRGGLLPAARPGPAWRR